MSIIFLSEHANAILKSFLIERGHQLLEVKETPFVYHAVASHADIYLCKVGQKIIIAREQLPYIEKQLSEIKLDIHHSSLNGIAGASSLGYKYPDNIKYNAAQVGNFIIHNTKHTDSSLLRLAKEEGLEIIDVRQGYTKCNLVPVDDHSLITSDQGMAKVLKKWGLNVLHISSSHVKLAGFPYGFLGGASGKIGNNLIFHGDLSAHPDFLEIKNFIEKRGLALIYFKEFPLEDIGSIIESGGEIVEKACNYSHIYSP